MNFVLEIHQDRPAPKEKHDILIDFDHRNKLRYDFKGHSCLEVEICKNPTKMFKTYLYY